MPSIHNMIEVMRQLSCDCKPHDDVKTYVGWKSEGMQVQRGSKGIRLVTFIDITDDNKQPTGKKRPWTATVFCRHQVVQMKEKK